MNYADVEARYRELKAQVAAGALTEDGFKAQLKELMIQDDGGRWWIIGHETGDWYVFDGEEWMQAAPPVEPAPAPVPPAEPLPETASALPSEPAPETPVVTYEPPPISEPPFELRPAPVAAPEAGVLASLRVTPAPAAEGVMPPLPQPAAEPSAVRPSFLASLKVPWAPVLIMAVGWGLGGLLTIGGSLNIGGSLAGRIVPAMGFNALVDGIIGGVAVMWACRWPGRPWHWSRTAALVAGWGVVWALGGLCLAYLYVSASYRQYSGNLAMIWTVGALVGGLLTAAVLRWAGEALTRGQMAIIAVGWALTYLVASLLVTSSRPLLNVLNTSPMGSTVTMLIFGAIGGWIMLTQLVSARRGAGEAPAAAAPADARAELHPAAAWPRWAPVAIIAAGWVAGLSVLAPFAYTGSDLWPVSLALAFILGGAATAFVCRREGVVLRWYHVLLILLISPLLIGLILRWAEPRFRWRQAAILFGAWALPAGIGYGVAYVVADSASYSEAKAVLAFLLWGLTMGASGGWAIVDQLARMRRRAESTG